MTIIAAVDGPVRPSRPPRDGNPMAQLYFYYSAMNAGKSTTLLQSAHNYQERGMRTLLYAPAIDDRSGSPRIHSRIGLSAEATPFDAAYDFHAAVSAALVGTAHQRELDDALGFAAAGPLDATTCDAVRAVTIDDERLLDPPTWPAM